MIGILTRPDRSTMKKDSVEKMKEKECRLRCLPFYIYSRLLRKIFTSMGFQDLSIIRIQN